MDHRDLEDYRERQRRAFQSASGDIVTSTSALPAQRVCPCTSSSAADICATIESPPPRLRADNPNVVHAAGTENDAVIAQMLAQELERNAQHGSGDNTDVDPETAALIAKVLEDDLANLERQELRPPDTVFTEQLIPASNTRREEEPPLRPFGFLRSSAPSLPRNSSPLTGEDSPSVEPVETDDDILARRLQEEEFLRDTTASSMDAIH